MTNPQTPSELAPSARMRWLLTAILGLGVLIRLAQFFAGRSLWHDEASLALNFFDRGYARLLAPLAHHQAAPLGFLVWTEFAVQVAGISELVLRFLPLLAGLAALIANWRLTRRWLSGGPLLFANYIFAISASLIFYSNEFKPYVLDALLSLSITGLLLAWWEDGCPPRRLPWLAALGAVAVWFSFPVIFVLAGVGGVLLLSCWWARPQRSWTGLSLVVAVWLASFAGQYFVSGRQVAGMEDLTIYWREAHAFLPWPPWKPATWAWLAGTFLNYFEDIGGMHSSRNIFPFLFLAGVIGMVQRGLAVRLAALLSPALLAVAASALERYPFQGRLALFSAPLLLLICAEGVRELFTHLRSPALRAALVGVALFSPSAYTLPQLWRPVQIEEVRPLVQYLRREAAPADLVLVFHNQSSFDYYARRLGLAVARIPFDEPTLPDAALQIPPVLNAGHRGWLFLSHFTDPERDAILSYLRHSYDVRQVCDQVGAELFIVENKPSKGLAKTPGVR